MPAYAGIFFGTEFEFGSVGNITMKIKAAILFTILLFTSVSIRSIAQVSDGGISQVSVKVFPNPASKDLTFSFSGADIQAIEVDIYELTGLEIAAFRPQTNTYIFDVSSLKEGLYFYNVLYNGKVIQSEKFVVLKK